MRPAPTSARALLSLLLLAAAAGACDGTVSEDLADAGAAALVDRCGGKCSEVELCVSDHDGNYGCARICYNQLRCWSGCCLPLGERDLNVCRPRNYCYAE